MTGFIRGVTAILTLSLLVAPVAARPVTAPPAVIAWSSIAPDPAMQSVLERARDATVAKFADAGLKADLLAMTVVDITNRSAPRRASWRGDQLTYPASVVKLFYLGAVERALEDGRLEDSPELQAGLRDMIVDSSNDATHYILDVLSGVTGGPELSDAELAAWGERRSVVNRLFESLGYTGVNAVQKTWCEAPYGRERQWVGANRERRNMVTTDAVSRLWFEMVTGQFINESRSRVMLALTERDPWRSAGMWDEQAHFVSGQVLPPGSTYHSKAGWTSEVTHDTAHVRLPNGAEYIVAIFTKDVANERDIVPFVARAVMEEMLTRGAKATSIYRNGRIWTGNPEKPWAKSMAVQGEVLLAVGDDADTSPLAGPGTTTVDLGGRLVLPGFIDAHTHFVSSGEELLSVDVRNCATPDEFARRIGDYAKTRPKGSWIVGGGWDHESWPGAPLPTRQLIDAVAPNNPVFLWRLDGHMAVANSAALELAGVKRDTAVPAGGEIVRDASGEAAGVLKDAAMGLVFAKIPASSPPDLDRAVDAALGVAGRCGVTSVQDIGTFEHLEAYRRAKASGRLSVRVSLRTSLADWERQAKEVAANGQGDAWVKLGGLKAFMDGSLGSTTAAFFAPYLDAPATSGLLSDEMADRPAFLDRVKRADAAGLQVEVHAIGDRANSMLLDIFERVARDNGPRDRRFRIEHAQHVRHTDIARLARDGVIASMQPYHAIDDGRWAGKRLDPARLATSYAWRSVLDAGGQLAFGSDWSVAPLDPLLGIYAAVTRRTLDERNPGGWIPEQRITVEEAVRAYTSGAAYAGFEEHYKGRLAAGYLADFVVLSEDVFAIDAVRIRDVKVERTVVGGRQVFPATGR